LGEVVRERERDESRAGSKIELAADAGAVPFSRADGDAQQVCDFPIGVPVREQLQDFALADGEEVGAGHGRVSHWRLRTR
jgi:hypothetical protein